MIGFIILPLLLALLIFAYVRILSLAKENKHKIFRTLAAIFGVFFFGGLIAVVLSFFIKEHTSNLILTKISNYWLGFILYFFLGLLISVAVGFIIWIFTGHKENKKIVVRCISYVLAIIFTFIMSIYGMKNAHDLKLIKYDVTINKKCNVDNLNVVLISDLHLGYNMGVKEVSDVVEKINCCNPDVVIIAGDIFDNDFNKIRQPQEIINAFKKIRAEHKYAILGNHDIQEDIFIGFTVDDDSLPCASKEMINMIKESGFNILHDSFSIVNDSIYIYGRADAYKTNLGDSARVKASDITKVLNTNYPIICIDHEPGELKELSNAGVDLDLSGHTHAGQVWPGTILIDYFWDNAYGLKKINNMTSIVTSGVGLFGPNMRTGSSAEVVNINIQFKK